MTRDDLIRLATRLVQGLVPTLEKKVYAYQGHITPLLAARPPSITVLTRVTDACKQHGLPTLAEGIPVYLREQLPGLIRRFQAGRATNLIVVQEAALLARYRVPLPLLYELTGDSQAIILHVDEGLPPSSLDVPSLCHLPP